MIHVPDETMQRNIERYGQRVAEDCPEGTGVIILLVRSGKLFTASNLRADTTRDNLRKAAANYAPKSSLVTLPGGLHG